MWGARGRRGCRLLRTLKVGRGIGRRCIVDGHVSGRRGQDAPADASRHGLPSLQGRLELHAANVSQRRRARLLDGNRARTAARLSAQCRHLWHRQFDHVAALVVHLKLGPTNPFGMGGYAPIFWKIIKNTLVEIINFLL